MCSDQARCAGDDLAGANVMTDAQQDAGRADGCHGTGQGASQPALLAGGGEPPLAARLVVGVRDAMGIAARTLYAVRMQRVGIARMPNKMPSGMSV
ncbi:phosphoanhydride phosphohydrolase, partial [Xanthomonas vasicola pv. musacearum NCPPB 4384]